MYLTKRSKERRIKEIEAEIDKYQHEIEVIQKIISELNTKYLPIRDKCIETIRSHNLGIYTLDNVFAHHYESGKLRLVVSDAKEEYWNGYKRVMHGDILLDETIQLDIPGNYDVYVLDGSYQLDNLMDLTKVYTYDISRYNNVIYELKEKLAKLNK